MGLHLCCSFHWGGGRRPHPVLPFTLEESLLLVTVTDFLLVNWREGGLSFPNFLFTFESSCNASDHQWQRCWSKVCLDNGFIATYNTLQREAYIKTRFLFKFQQQLLSSFFFVLFLSRGMRCFCFYQPAVTHCTHTFFLCGCCKDGFELCCFSRMCARRPAWVCTACAWATRRTTSRGAASFCPSSPVSSPS